MKRLLLKNASLEKLTPCQVIFKGELKGYYQRLTYSITENRYKDLLQLSAAQKYNIWIIENIIKFKRAN